MIQPYCGSNREQVIDTMIELTRLSHLHRAIVAGSDGMELYLALRRRGFIRVATTRRAGFHGAARGWSDHGSKLARDH